MGAKPSVHIQTPVFTPKQWQYVPDSSQTIEQYGIFRTLRNLKSGQKIDEYEFMWPNQEEYDYYLKSFNWRYKQPNVVSTKFMVQTSKRSMCSMSYTARIYIEHMKVRLSQISDIPFPDNLYVLMESLEGYRKIFQHSKYFQIEECQICVDEYGSVKIWVNSDLSINYPANEGFLDFKDKGQQEMVQTLVDMIAENTDKDTEPSPSFQDFFNERKGADGKNFQEAKVLVMNYSRLTNTQIPVRFDAIVNLDAEEQQNINKFVQDSLSGVNFNNNGRQNQKSTKPNGGHARPGPTTIHFSTNPNAVYHIKNAQFTNSVLPRPYPYPSPYQTQPLSYQKIYAVPNGYFPQVPYQNYPLQQGYRLLNGNNLVYLQKPIQGVNSQLNLKQDSPTQKQVAQSSNKKQQLKFLTPQSEAKKKNPNSLNSLYEKNKNQQINSAVQNQLKKQYQLQPSDLQQFQKDVTNQPNDNKPQQQHYSFQSHKRKTSSSNREPSSMSVSEADDVVARSLPIKTDASQHRKHLGNLGHNQKAAYSQVTTNPWPNNTGFGLTSNLERQKQSDPSDKKKIYSNSLISASQARPVKYFYTLDDEEEMDPDIAADLARYIL